jgi:small-conductance mechanosensitive channel
MLAGAGIVGIVLGMGAQSLLKDILAGIFFVIDDAFRLGEYVEIGETRGTVEKISLRSMQIRHHRGALQTLPYGTIQSVKNLSRDWVISKLEFQVPHDTDILKVKKVIKALSRQIEEDEYFGPQMLSPVKFQGIYGVDLYGLTVRVKFTTLPGEQFLIRREVYRLVQQGFANNGIEFAERTVKVDRSDDVIATADDTEAPRVSASG